MESLPVYFAIVTRPKPLKELLALHGDLVIDDLSLKDRATAETITNARSKYETGLIERGYTDPTSGTIVGISYLDPTTGKFEHRSGDEVDLIRDLWSRHEKPNALLAGWGILDRDLHWLKVRSWANKIEIPTTAMRRNFASKCLWTRFHDLQRDFSGGPTEIEFHKVAGSFGFPGRRPTPLQIAEDPSVLEPFLGTTAALANCRKTREFPVGLSDADIDKIVRDFLQPGGADDRSCLSHDLTWDIETAPGEIADLKRIMGEFDPGAVKVSNLTDPVKIRAKIDGARATYDEKLLDDSQKDPFLGRISSIGFKLPGKEPLILDQTERDQVRIFKRMREVHTGTWQGWNTFGFDNEWMRVKAMLVGLGDLTPLCTISQNGYPRWDKFRDLMIEWTGSRGKYMKLHAASVSLGLPGKSGNGADFYKNFESPDPELRAKGRQYLVDDVTQEEGVAQAMGFLPIEMGKPDLRASIAQDLDQLEKKLFSSRTVDVADFDALG